MTTRSDRRESMKTGVAKLPTPDEAALARFNYIENHVEAIWRLDLRPPIPLDLPVEEQVERLYRDAYYGDCNAALAHHYGSDSPAEIIGRPIRHFIPSDLPSTKGLFREVVESRYRKNDFETIEVDREGNEIYIINNLAGQIEDGKLVSVWGSARNITEQRRAEALLEEQQLQLTQVSRVTALGEFAVWLTHELSQPLFAILSNSQAGIRFLDQGDPDKDKIREILVDIEADIKRTRDLVTHVRELITEEKHERVPLNVNREIQQMCLLVRGDLNKKNVELETWLDPELLGVSGDPVLLKQAFLNLLLNACDAVQHLEPEERKIEVSTRNVDDEEIEVTVADSGSGIDEETLDQIFQPLFTTKKGGMGMGLTINKTIIEKHGGRIWVENGPNHGAVFHIALPADKSEAPY